MCTLIRSTIKTHEFNTRQSIYVFVVITWQGGGVTTCKIIALLLLYLPILNRTRDKCVGPYLFGPDALEPKTITNVTRATRNMW